MTSFLSFARKRKKNFLLLLAGNSSAHIFLFALSPILLRLYGPEEFGVYGIFVALSATIAGVAGWRIEFAIPVARSGRSASTILILTLLVALPTAFVLSILLFYASRAGYLGLFSDELGLFILWLPLASFGILAYQAITYWLLWHRRYRAVVAVRWVQALSIAVVQLAGYWLSLKGFGLILGHSAGQLSGAFSGLKGGLGNLKSICCSLSRRRVVRLFLALRRYPTIMVPSSLMNMAGQHLPVLFIGMLYGLVPAGLYATAQRICGVPISLIGQAIGQIYTAEASRAIVSNRSDLTVNFLNLMRFMGPMAILFLVAILALSPMVTAFAFGDTWRDLGAVMQILAIVFVLDFLITPISLTLSFTKRYRSQLFWDALRLFAVLMTFLVSSLMGLPFSGAIKLLAASMALCQMLLIYIIWRALKAVESRVASEGRFA